MKPCRSAKLHAFILFCLPLLIVAQEPVPELPGGCGIWAGGGWHSGATTYEIGGRVRQNGEIYHVRDPISRLEFPYEIPVIAGGIWHKRGRFDFSLSGSGFESASAIDVEDSDWDNDGRKIIYSESEADLSTYSVEASARYWIFYPQTAPCVQFGVGLGLLWQQTDWDVKNLDQWYPYNPELGHDTVDGLVATYETSMLMPYAEVCATAFLYPVEIRISLGGSPWTYIYDRDDHILRSIEAETDAYGVAAIASAELRCYVYEALYLSARFAGFSAYATGTEEDRVYAGDNEGDTWEIDHDIVTHQGSAMLLLGCDL